MGDSARIDERESVDVRDESLSISKRFMHNVVQGFGGILLGAVAGSLLAAGSFLAIETQMPQMIPVGATAVIDRTVQG